MCNFLAGDAVPIPTYELVTSNTNKFVSNAKSVPDLNRLALSICPDIRPIAIFDPWFFKYFYLLFICSAVKQTVKYPSRLCKIRLYQ